MVMYVTKESTGFCLWQINEFSRQYLYPYYCNLSLLVAENVAVGNPLWSRMSLVVNKWCIFLESFRTMASQASTLSSPLTNNCRNDTKGIRICCRSSLASGVSLKGPFLCAVMKGVGGGGGLSLYYRSRFGECTPSGIISKHHTASCATSSQPSIPAPSHIRLPFTLAHKLLTPHPSHQKKRYPFIPPSLQSDVSPRASEAGRPTASQIS